jgi:hypothetical protein
VPYTLSLIKSISARVRNLSSRAVRSFAILMQNMCHGNKTSPNVLLKITQKKCRMRRKILEIFQATGSLLEGKKIRKVIFVS